MSTITTITSEGRTTHKERGHLDGCWHTGENVAATASAAALYVDAGRKEDTVGAVTAGYGDGLHGRFTMSRLGHLTGYDLYKTIVYR